MNIICDECQAPTDVKDITTEPYVESATPYLGIVKEWYICKGCAEEKSYWRSATGLDGNGHPGI